MAGFQYLNKSDFDKHAQDIFNILADNMSAIAPTGNTREDDYNCWYEAVKDGIKSENRQIILIFETTPERIIGYFQYYTNSDTFMMEEIQIISYYQTKDNIFRDLYGYALSNIDNSIPYVEAYANKQNEKSIGILKKLGLSIIGLSKNGNCYHFKGFLKDLIKWYYKNEEVHHE